MFALLPCITFSTHIAHATKLFCTQHNAHKTCKHYLEKKLVICYYLFILTLGNLYAMEVWYGCKKEGNNEEGSSEAQGSNQEEGSNEA
jgi:hypothetical protein